MNELRARDFQGRKVVDSRDVAAMVERSHRDLLRDIRKYIDVLESASPAERNFAPSDFFVEAKYTDSTGRELPCYLVTKKGCDMIANKLTGKKGVLFTYVTAFEQMNERLNATPVIPNVSPSGLADLLRITRRIMLDMGSTPTDVGQMAQNIFQAWNVPVPAALAKQLPGQVSLFDVPAMEGIEF